MGEERRTAMGDVTFEVGQVVRVVEADDDKIVRDMALIVEMVRDDMFWCVGIRSDTNDYHRYRFSGTSDNHHFGLLAPAPRAGDTWTSSAGAALIYEACIDSTEPQLRIVTQGEPFVGDVVDVARHLWEARYRLATRSCIACVEVENAGGAWRPHSCGRTNLEITTHGPEATCADVRERLHEAVAALGVNEFAKDRSGHGNDLVVSDQPVWSADGRQVSLPPLPVGQFIVSVDFQNRLVSVRGQDGELLPEIATTLVDASSEEFVTAEATQPAPSKFAQVPLATSRRLVDEAVKTLRGEPFTKAIQATLISLCGDRLEFGPRQVDIQAAINACQAWEYARGKVAPGKRSLSAAEHRELTETAKIAAWGAGISMPDASDIGEIVGETYERVRATC